MSQKVAVQVLYSSYAAHIIEEIRSLQSRVGLKVARLWRHDHGCFGDPHHPRCGAPPRRAALYRRYYHQCRAGPGGVLQDEEAIEAFVGYMAFYHVVHQHFQPEIQALRTLVD